MKKFLALALALTLGFCMIGCGAEKKKETKPADKPAADKPADKPAGDKPADPPADPK